MEPAVPRSLSAPSICLHLLLFILFVFQLHRDSVVLWPGVCVSGGGGVGWGGCVNSSITAHTLSAVSPAAHPSLFASPGSFQKCSIRSRVRPLQGARSRSSPGSPPIQGRNLGPGRAPGGGGDNALRSPPVKPTWCHNKKPEDLMIIIICRACVCRPQCS